ncbi:MAG: phosphotransferase [Desulfobacterales bacterium]
MKFEEINLKSYLEAQFGDNVEISEILQLTGKDGKSEALKQFGFGRPFLVSCKIGKSNRRLVFHRINRNAFGREREEDQVAAVWLDFRTFGRLPRHVSAADMIILTKSGELKSVRDAEEMLLVTDYRDGRLYADDLIRIRDNPTLRPLDLLRAERLGVYLAEIHRKKHNDPSLWRRRLRDLIGHGEGIMGLTDSYPGDQSYASPGYLRSIEEMANRWRWRLKPMSQRLSQVHGDFHPFNILFEESDRFWVLDRSRGEWGEPSDDVSCLVINYLFFSLQRFGRLESPFVDLHDAFWDSYLAAAEDDGLLKVIQPWFAWRALVLSSPVWYPALNLEVRVKLLRFAKRVMGLKRYDLSKANRYMETG